MIEKLRKIGGQQAINLNLKTLLGGIRFKPGIDTTHCFYEALVLAAAIPKCFLVRDGVPDYVLIAFSDANYRYFKDVFNSDKSRSTLILTQPDLYDLEDFYHKRLNFYCTKVAETKKGIPPSEITCSVYEKPLMSHRDLIRYDIQGNLKAEDPQLMSIVALKIIEVDLDTSIRSLE